jgi:thiol:disulfide interchange protein
VEIDVDFGRDAFTVCYDPDELDEVRIRGAIERLGFRARQAPPEAAAEEPAPGGEIPAPIAAALAEARASGRLLLVDFFAAWCAPCKVMDREILPHPAVRAATLGYLLLHVDTDEFPEAGRRFGIDAMPTVVALDAGGGELHRFVGLVEAEEMARQLLRIRSEAMGRGKG